MDKVGIHRTIAAPFDEAVQKVIDALKSEGFGVLTEIDVRETLKKKLNVDFRRYKILGACNPPFAHRALEHDLGVGLLLPCNVIVYEEEGGRSHVAAIDPMQTVAAQGAPGLVEIAGEVHQKLERVLLRVAG